MTLWTPFASFCAVSQGPAVANGIASASQALITRGFAAPRLGQREWNRANGEK